jgi:hypothetical protein
MLFGLPMTIILVPACILHLMISCVELFLYYDQPWMQPYYSFTEAIVCRLSNAL